MRASFQMEQIGTLVNADSTTWQNDSWTSSRLPRYVIREQRESASESCESKERCSTKRLQSQMWLWKSNFPISHIMERSKRYTKSEKSLLSFIVILLCGTFFPGQSCEEPRRLFFHFFLSPFPIPSWLQLCSMVIVHDFHLARTSGERERERVGDKNSEFNLSRKKE